MNSMKETMNAPYPLDDDILTPEQAGELFGVSKWAMYKRVKNGMAPAHKMGKRVYFLRRELVKSVIES